MKKRRVSRVSAFVKFLLELPRPTKQAVMVLADGVVLPLCLCMAVALGQRAILDSADLADLLISAAAAAILTFWFLGLYRSVVRFIGPQTVGIVIVGVTVSAAAAWFAARSHAIGDLSPSTLAIYWSWSLLYLTGSRLVVRSMFNRCMNRSGAKRVVIYGAGAAGAKLSSVMMAGPDFVPVAFVDDNLSLRGSRINGIRVFDSRELAALIGTYDVERVLLAMPSAQKWRRREILAQLAPLGVHVQSLPDLSEIIAGRARIDEVKEVEISDLLGRDPVPPHTGAVRIPEFVASRSW